MLNEILSNLETIRDHTDSEEALDRLKERILDEDPKFQAGVELLAQVGSMHIELRTSLPKDDGVIVFVALVHGNDGSECAAGSTPLGAVNRLLEWVIDGAVCVNCRRPSGFEYDPGVSTICEDTLCWFKLDPAENRYHRSCDTRL